MIIIAVTCDSAVMEVYTKFACHKGESNQFIFRDWEWQERGGGAASWEFSEQELESSRKWQDISGRRKGTSKSMKK